MLTARERGRLRDRIAREAERRNIPNPLITDEEKEQVGAILVIHAAEKHAGSDKGAWEHITRMISNMARIPAKLEKEKKKDDATEVRG